MGKQILPRKKKKNFPPDQSTSELAALESFHAYQNCKQMRQLNYVTIPRVNPWHFNLAILNMHLCTRITKRLYKLQSLSQAIRHSQMSGL